MLASLQQTRRVLGSQFKSKSRKKRKWFATTWQTAPKAMQALKKEQIQRIKYKLPTLKIMVAREKRIVRKKQKLEKPQRQL